MKSSNPSLLICSALTWIAWSAPASADGSFGRIEGDAAVQFDLGGGADDGHGAISAGMTARYLQTAGLYTMWLVHPNDERHPRWSAAVGIELRPLFLPRFLQNWQGSSATWNLLLDSIGLRFAAVTASDGPLRHGGPGFDAGLGLSLPLSADSNGPLLASAACVRWSHVDMAASDDPHRAFVWTLTLAWQSIFDSRVVDAGDHGPQ